jgi:hypothetical protein
MMTSVDPDHDFLLWFWRRSRDDAEEQPEGGAQEGEEPSDPSFLRSFWEHSEIEVGDPDLAAVYVAETGKTPPNCTLERKRFYDAAATFERELDDGEVPRLVRYIAFEGDELPHDIETMSTLEDAIARYYGDVRARRALGAGQHPHGRGELVYLSFAWMHALPLDEPERTGTTDVDQIEELCETYVTLTALQPDHAYPIVRESDCWVYGAPSRTIDTAKLRSVPRGPLSGVQDVLLWWGDVVVLRKGEVVGPFAYASYAAAESAQRARVATVEARK